MLNNLSCAGRRVLPSIFRTISQNPSQISCYQKVQIRNIGSLLSRPKNGLNKSSMILIRKDNLSNIRMLSFRRGKIVMMGPLGMIFVFGFGGMFGLMLLENVYTNFKLSGQTLKDYLMSKKPTVDMKFWNENEKYDTRYASILDKDQVPEFNITRSVKGQFELPGVRLTLFQYQSCPFCCKVRTFLDYYGISYDIVEVNPVMRREVKFSKKYRKVPILLVQRSESEQKDGEEYALQINDSTLIISALTSYLLSLKPRSRHHNESLFNITRWYLNSQVYKHDDDDADISHVTYKAQQAADELVNKYFLMIGDVDPAKYERMDPPLAEERHWRRWVDDHFVHTLSPNIYRTLDESKRSFNHFSDISDWQQSMSDFERKFVIQAGAVAMYLISKNLKRKYHLADDVRDSLFDSGKYWISKGVSNRLFLGGNKPNLGDLAVYANFCAIEGCEAFSDAMKTNPKLEQWFTNVRHEVESNSGYELIKSFK